MHTTHKFVTGFCVLYQFVIGVYRSSVNFGAQDIFAGKYVYEKLAKCPNFTYTCLIDIFQDFFFFGGGVNAPLGLYFL